MTQTAPFKAQSERERKRGRKKTTQIKKQTNARVRMYVSSNDDCPGVFADGGVPSVLQEVKVPIMENSVCQEMFQTGGHSKRILDSFICAGYANGQKDSCEVSPKTYLLLSLSIHPSFLASAATRYKTLTGVCVIALFFFSLLSPLRT